MTLHSEGTCKLPFAPLEETFRVFPHPKQHQLDLPQAFGRLGPLSDRQECLQRFEQQNVAGFAVNSAIASVQSLLSPTTVKRERLRSSCTNP